MTAETMADGYRQHLAMFHRPTAWTVTGMGREWRPVVIWATESGQRVFQTDATAVADRGRAEAKAAVYWRQATAYYDVTLKDVQRYLFGDL